MSKIYPRTSTYVDSTRGLSAYYVALLGSLAGLRFISLGTSFLDSGADSSVSIAVSMLMISSFYIFIAFYFFDFDVGLLSSNS